MNGRPGNKKSDSVYALIIICGDIAMFFQLHVELDKAKDEFSCLFHKSATGKVFQNEYSIIFQSAVSV